LNKSSDLRQIEGAASSDIAVEARILKETSWRRSIEKKGGDSFYIKKEFVGKG